MRELERISRILNLLKEIWFKVPDWRLGQILVNADRKFSEIPFQYEDRDLEKVLMELNNEME